ncbi:MAG: LysM peptidoglycan-binding domain-containing protein [Alphaproteobacteria bacterium]|nr:LysM peptidoglycan-binding domain-containing protein [Alphaproteobacteria bacterium]
MSVVISKNFFSIIIVLISCLSLASCSSNFQRFGATDQIPISRSDTLTSSKKYVGDYWIVSDGDTIELISSETGVRVDDIAYYNSLRKPYVLNAGDRLFIAKRKTVDEPQLEKSIIENPENLGDLSGGAYVVKSGDTLSSIASRYNISVSKIIEINKIKDPSLIRIGQEIMIIPPIQTVNSETTNLIGSNADIMNKIQETNNPENEIINNPVFRWPVYGRVVSDFGDEAYGRINNGIYISAPLGAEVSASEGGVVTFVGNDDYFGEIIIIKHINNWVSSYAHLDNIAISIGDKISKGQVIGSVGATGIIESPSLYFELRRGTIVQNPSGILN